MIDINKKYRTRSGHPVRIYATDGGGLWPVHGAIQSGDFWVSISWEEDGSGSNSDFDLIEINEKEELLEEALKRYPKGTRFITPTHNQVHTSNGTINDVHFESLRALYSDEYEVYRNGKWAEIVKEHSVNIYFHKFSDGSIEARLTPWKNNLAKKTITFYEGEGL